MSPINHIALAMLLVTVAVAAGCFVIAWLDIALHQSHKTLPNEYEMRRYMLCGFYCNPEDPRPVVHRPRGWGYTINLRREQLVVVMLVMLMLAMLAAALLYVVPVQ